MGLPWYMIFRCFHEHTKTYLYLQIQMWDLACPSVSFLLLDQQCILLRYRTIAEVNLPRKRIRSVVVTLLGAVSFVSLVGKGKILLFFFNIRKLWFKCLILCKRCPTTQCSSSSSRYVSTSPRALRRRGHRERESSRTSSTSWPTTLVYRNEELSDHIFKIIP